MQSESNKRIEFIKPRDGTTNEFATPEQQAAVENFYELVDNTLLAHADKVVVSDYTTLPNTSWLGMRLRFADGTRLHIIVGTAEVGIGSTLHSREVCLQEFDASDQFQRRHTYKYVPGVEEVKRSDIYRKSDEDKRLEDTFKNEEYWHKQWELMASMTSGELANATDEVLNQLIAGNELERQMGLNHIPVEAAEIASLRELLQSAEPFQLKL